MTGLGLLKSYKSVLTFLFQTYDPFEERMKFYDKFFCRSLGEDEMVLKGWFTSPTVLECAPVVIVK